MERSAKTGRQDGSRAAVVGSLKVAFGPAATAPPPADLDRLLALLAQRSGAA